LEPVQPVLTAGYLLAKNEVDPVVLEADPIYVGGISRTVRYRGFHFDIGGHRFFSKSKAVEDLWQEILPNDMLERPPLLAHLLRSEIFRLPAQTLRSPLQARSPALRRLCSFLA
jgi:protoporphyrinogen oxidase